MFNRNSILRLIAFVAVSLLANSAVGQDVMPRMDQDSSLNNLVHPPETETCEFGELGRVDKVGSGSRSMILIAGSGFGGNVFDGFMKQFATEFTMYSVTLPGYGGTKPLPMPSEGTSYGDLTWHKSAQTGIEQLIENENLVEPIIIAHWVNATVIALRMGLDHPDQIGGVVIVSGVPRYLSMMPTMPTPENPAERASLVDNMMAPMWFKTVTRATWDDNNFLPADYAIHPLRGLQRWLDASSATLPVHVRYLCETWAQDITTELHELRVPTLVIQPQLDEAYVSMPKTGEYLDMMLYQAWEGVAEKNDRIQFERIENARVSIMDDRPKLLSDAVQRFVDDAKN